jgi:hypothetical protein
MSKTKLLAGFLLVLAVLFAQVGSALAAPVAQETTPISGTIQRVITETDDNGVTTVVVTLLTEAGETKTLRLSVGTAAGILTDEGTALVTINPDTQQVTVGESLGGQTVQVDPATVLPDEEPTGEAVHPIAAILAKFFGVEPGIVQGYHEDGYGFGVIAQAMWMAKSLSEGSEVALVDAGLILQAKKNGDYSAFLLTDGSTPTNWGQFKKAVMGKNKNNLGSIVSGHADTGETEAQTLQNNGHGNGYGKDNNPGKGKGKNKP